MFVQRFHCLRGYTAVFRDEDIKLPTADDLASLHQIFKSDEEPILHRVHCGFTLGVLLVRMCDPQAAAKRCRQAIALAESATVADRAIQVMFIHPAEGLVQKETGEVLDDALIYLRANLKSLEQRPQTIAETPVRVRDSTKMFAVPLGPLRRGSDAQRRQFVNSIIKRATTVVPFRSKRSGRAYGVKCDACGTSEARLKYCARCNRAAYCSTVCQRNAWATHRTSCRPPHAFMAGDLALISGLEGAAYQNRNGSIVEVRGPAPDREDRWRVAYKGDLPNVNDFSIQADKLRLVVPSNERDELLQREWACERRPRLLKCKTTLSESLRFMYAATAAASRRDWRAAADAYQAAFHGKSPAFLYRFMCLRAYTTIFRDGQISTPTADDLAFLNQIPKSDGEPILHRVHCGFTLGVILIRLFVPQAAAKRIGQAIDRAESASAAERRVRVRFIHQDEGLVEKEIGKLLDDALDYLRANLKLLERRPQTLQQTPPAKDSVPTDYVGQSAQLPRLRCNRAAYLPSVCQRIAWSTHGLSCRPPRTFVAGDLVLIGGLTGEAYQDRNGDIVVVRGAVLGSLARGAPWRLAGRRWLQHPR
ncbi:hypothetical protein BDK51DRAFT_51103 [Blyttiomyces helicus]|uniref:MYND-type domain-containing protein n=1 Tax=Blyttiomyces helicus TaxID=388810 RepID=A0A4V1IRE4_9FUNG|nr:hypothetical protein BDK51DRAFT_51103 [Blyttiomyces helicus]|eukprot:RKO89767.1 hypothetical protein BDK51DRAFT_51103 [Blyttiomyces helicus]